jgi:hypothetical protein
MVRRSVLSLAVVAVVLASFGCNDSKTTPAATGAGKGTGPVIGKGAEAPPPPPPPPR